MSFRNRYASPADGPSGRYAARDRRSAGGQRGQLRLGNGDVQALAARLELRLSTELRDEGAAHVAPERGARRQGRVHFRRAELKQAVPGAPSECRADPFGGGGIDRIGVGRVAHDQRPRGCQREEETRCHIPGDDRSGGPHHRSAGRAIPPKRATLAGKSRPRVKWSWSLPSPTRASLRIRSSTMFLPFR